MKKNGIKYTVLALSFLLMIPMHVSATEASLTKDLTLIVSDMDTAEKQAEEKFDKVLEVEGKKYELTDIAYETVETEYLDKKEKNLELKEEPKKTMTEGGVEYTLKSSEKIENVIEESTEQTVTAYDDYDYAVTAADVPVTKTVNAVNNITGAEEQVVCSFTGISDAGITTVDNIMTITFSDYDASYYEWNGTYIPRNDAVPPLAGYEDSLLASVGAAEGSTVTGYYWSSDPYTVDGVMYRDAAATVQQQVQMYRANYVGKILTPEKKETVYKAVYETHDTEGDKELTVKATATYAEVESQIPYIIAGIGLFLLLILIVVIVYVISKKRKKSDTNSTN